ncbi:MAG: DUF4091 domain-containing protein [Kiritimatiellales bacterium]|nr:DUF4091 domain-containing protein [Kiritimatiellales bacterium]
MPAEWKFQSWQDAEGWRDGSISRSGGESLGLRGINGGWSTTVPTKPGAVHTVRFVYRSEKAKGRIVLYVRDPSAARKVETILYKPLPIIDSNQTGQFVDGVYTGGADADGWIAFEGGAFIPEARTTSVNLLIKLRGADHDAKVWLDDVVVTVEEPRPIPDTAKLLFSDASGKVWAENENRKVLPSQKPPTGAPAKEIGISAAKGEYESFQLVVTPNREWKDVKWTWSGFTGPAELDASVLRCRRVELIPIEETYGPYGYKGLNPDPLTDPLPCTVPAGTNQAFWFTLQVPSEQQTGIYRTELALVPDAQTVLKIPVQLHVRNFSVSMAPSIAVTSHFRAPLALARESGPEDEVLQRYYRNCFDHRSTCSPGVQVGIRRRGDTVTVDAERYIEHLRFMRDELGSDHINVPSLWIGHAEGHLMPADAQWKGRTIFSNPELTVLNPEFEKPFRDYMGQLCERLKNEKLFVNPTVRFFDEPRFEDQATVNGLRTLSKLLLDIDPELTVSIAASYPHPGLIDVIRLWILHTDAWDRNLHWIEAARKAGCYISVYNNGINYPEHRPIRIRLWPWLLWKYGVDGTHSWWGMVCWRNEMADPWTAGRGSSGVMLYPPRSADEKGPIDSIRWELFREGLEDYEYMRLANDLADRLTAQSKLKSVQIGRDALAEAVGLVEKWPNVKAANDEPYTLDAGAVALARNRLAEAIETMQQELDN